MTEQEQTKQMLKTLCDKFQCSVIDRSYMAKSCRQCEDIVEALHEAGYGDVSEYKAEIERLKAKCEEQDNEIGKLECVIKENDERCFDCPQVKQAKIDTLNKVKKCSCCDNFFPDSKWHRYVFVDDIDKLIEEIEKQ